MDRDDQRHEPREEAVIEHAYHQSLRLKSFTCFSDATLEFVPGVNVFVGENGTGKTHALKALYAWQLGQQRNRNTAAESTEATVLKRVFQLEDGAELVRLNGAKDASATVSGTYGSSDWGINLWPGGIVSFSGGPHVTRRPVFIPAIEMMGHTSHFLSVFDEFAIDFDLTQRDIVSLMLAPEKRELSGAESRLVDQLEATIQAKVEVVGERFYVVSGDTRMPVTMVAEGIRRVATLIRLVRCGWLNGPESTLMWDEPEASLNPRLMDEAVEAILAMARAGTQVLLATHNYVILKELDLQSNVADNVRYFSFNKQPSGTTVSWSSDFAQLEPNPILDQFDRLFALDMERALHTEA